MNILVDEVPKTCSKCLFIGPVTKQTFNNVISFTGCRLLKIKISFDFASNYRVNECPLKDIKDFKLNIKEIHEDLKKY